MKAKAVSSRFRATLDGGDKVIGAAVGSGMASRHLLAGGADFLLIATGGRFRTAGVPSIGAYLPMGNANEIVLRPAVTEVLPRAGGKPVFIGLSPTDPSHDWRDLLRQVVDAGFDGVNNFPSMGFFDGPLRRLLDGSGYGYSREVEYIKEALRLGLFTLPFVYSEDEARQMAAAGANGICVNLNLPVTEKTFSGQGIEMAKLADTFNKVFQAAERENPGLFRFFYCVGPIANPDDLDQVIQATSADGYMGGSIFERIPTAAAMEEIGSQYKRIIHLAHENKNLRRELLRKKGFDEIVGQSGVMQDLYEVVNKVADKDVNVLITGESGTGKELVVKAIHFNSRRFDRPFIKINCAAIPEALLESELFGHTKGAFTGAMEDRVGLFQLADKGTLFLDEISELGLGIQAKLLRVIQQRELQRLGSDRVVKLDFRLIAATNVNLLDLVSKGKFREDLYYRLNVVTIHTPALRAHKEDIPILASHFLRRAASKLEQHPCRLAPEAMEAIQRHDWPGNVRELEHAIESASVLCSDFLIGRKHLPVSVSNASPTGWEEEKTRLDASPRQEPLPEAPANPSERNRILQTLALCGWRRGKAAEKLRISRKTLYNKMQKYDIRNGY